MTPSIAPWAGFSHKDSTNYNQFRQQWEPSHAIMCLPTCEYRADSLQWNQYETAP